MIVGLHHDCHHPVHVRFRSQERMNLEIYLFYRHWTTICNYSN